MWIDLKCCHFIRRSILFSRLSYYQCKLLLLSVLSQGNDGIDVERAPHAENAVTGPVRRPESADGRGTGRAGGQVTVVPESGRGRCRGEWPVRPAVRHIQRGRGGRRPTPVEPVGLVAGPGRTLPTVGRRRRRWRRSVRAGGRRQSPTAAAAPPTAAPSEYLPTTPRGGGDRKRFPVLAVSSDAAVATQPPSPAPPAPSAGRRPVVDAAAVVPGDGRLARMPVAARPPDDAALTAPIE